MIKVLHKALNILEFVSRSSEGQTLSAIAAAIGEKPTTTANIVQVLAQRNYLERRDGKWRLGINAYMLTGSSADYDVGICRLAEPVLRRLSEETEATAVLSVWRGQERYVLLRIADGSAVTVNREYPEATRIYGTATGILLLSARDREQIDAHIEAHGVPNHPTPTPEEVSAFYGVLDRCRRQGYYYRQTADIFEAAAPVRDHGGNIRTAVGIFLPAFRVKAPEELVAALLNGTEALEAALQSGESL